MGDLLDYLPIAAAAFAIPQFLPQLRKLRATDDTAGVSWSWATLTSVNNAAWFAYFALASYWTALVPAASATLLAGTLTIMLTRRRPAKTRPAVLISGWVALLIAGVTVAGRAGLARCSRSPSSSRSPPRSGPPTGPRTPPASQPEPGCSSWGSCRAGRSSVSTRPTHACSPSASPVSPPAPSCSPGSATHADTNPAGDRRTR